MQKPTHSEDNNHTGWFGSL